MLGKYELKTVREYVGAVQVPVDSKRLGKTGRSPCKVPVRAGITAPAPRCLQSPNNLAGAQQQTRCMSGNPADHVGAVMHPVREVHVEVTSLAEHRGVAGGLPAEGVRPWILRSHVRLHLRDTHGDRLRTVVVREVCTKEQRRNLDGRMRKAGALQGWIHQKTVSIPPRMQRTAMSDFR